MNRRSPRFRVGGFSGKAVGTAPAVTAVIAISEFVVDVVFNYPITVVFPATPWVEFKINPEVTPNACLDIAQSQANVARCIMDLPVVVGQEYEVLVPTPMISPAMDTSQFGLVSD